MTPFQPEDKVLVNGKHAEVKTLKDIGGGHFEVGVVYTEDKRFDTVIYPFTEIQKIDSPIESAKKKIELAGMKAVIQYETEHLRTPTDVSLEFVGYDIKSTSNEEIRYIEVKAFENTGIVEMTENEWKTAQKLKIIRQETRYLISDWKIKTFV